MKSEVYKTDVKLCHENQSYKWVKLEKLDNYDFVPGLTKDLKTLGTVLGLNIKEENIIKIRI